MTTTQMQIRDFHILGVPTGNSIDACAQFVFRNFLISMSTAGLSRGSCQTKVAIFPKDDIASNQIGEFDTVEEAVDFILHQETMEFVMQSEPK